VAPPGRLVRLGVVLDTRNPPQRLGEVARMCDRAGIDALWVLDRLLTSHARIDAVEPRLEPWTALGLAARDTRRAKIGAMLDIDFRPADTLASMAAALAASRGGRLEIGFSASSPGLGVHEAWPGSADALDRGRRIEAHVTAVRRFLREGSLDIAALDSSGEPPDAARGGQFPARWPMTGAPPLAVEGRSPAEIDVAARVADDVVLSPPGIGDIVTAIGAVHCACAVAGRDPASLGIAVTLPVSIGRTSAEARARASAEPLFQGPNDPTRIGIFGTLEQCQQRVIELAHAGVTDLRCIVPNAPDVHDVIAQLTAMVVGSRAALRPDSPRSRDPDPPAGWGGRRPDRPRDA
jgi:alkanesulfonate monooxygenase SsuD/methylene tetrahydromethanopterin reductase-like flavin-dependent oxidoreductase (luciferase family)